MRESLQRTPHFAPGSWPAPLQAALRSAGVARQRGPKRNGSAGSRGVAHRAVAVGDAQRLAARVRLLEAFVGRSDITDCTRYALQWLHEILDLTPSLCLLKPDGKEALFAVGAHGLAGTAASRFTVSLEDRNNALVAAFSNREHAFFRSAHSSPDRKRRPSTPFEDEAFHVVPLFAADLNRDAFGLLLIGGSGALPPESRWFTTLFAQKLAQVLRQQALVEGGGTPWLERSPLDEIINAVADPIVVTDATGATALMNESAERLFIVPARASAREQQWVRSNDAHFSSFIAGMLASADERRVGEIGLIDPKLGEPLPVEAIAGKILSDGELTAVVTILHDRREAIEKGKLYQQLQQASDELERRIQAATADIAHQNELLRRQAIELQQASALKSQFLANMSHEFRTPLNAMLGYTSMLLQGVAGPLDARAKRHLSRVESNGRHLLTIINEILDISRIEAGRMPLQLSRFDVPELIAEVRAELEPIILRSKLAVTIDLPKDSPQMVSDRQKVKQILLNLLSNALKFTHEGRITVSVRRNAKDRTMALSVADTGIGIAPADHGKIFKDFGQLDNSPTRAYGGTGLGLSICRRLARMLGGSITLRSQLGKGSMFTLVLPIRGRR